MSHGIERGRSHEEVEFAVDDPRNRQLIFKTFDAASGFAVEVAASTGTPVNIDILVYGRAGARYWAGDDGVERYEEDPDASVFERIEIRADFQGGVR